MPVRTAVATPAEGYRIERHYTGRISARRQVDLSFPLDGRIEAIEVDVGDRLAEGAPLATLDTRRLDARLDRLAANLRETDAELTLAEANLARRQRLQRERLVAEETLDELRARRDRIIARRDALRAERAALLIDLADSRLEAPFAAVVTERRAELGQMTGPRTPGFRLLALETPEVRIGLPVAAAERLAVGDSVHLIWRSRELDGRVRALVPEVNGATRTITAVIDPVAPPQSLVAGEVVQLRMSEWVTEPGFWVPNSALVAAPRGLWSVYLARPMDADAALVERAALELLHSEAERSFVRGTLTPGNAFIVDGTHRLSPGQQVVTISVETPVTQR